MQDLTPKRLVESWFAWVYRHFERGDRVPQKPFAQRWGIKTKDRGSRELPVQVVQGHASAMRGVSLCVVGGGLERLDGAAVNCRQGVCRCET